jgi:hypothetical protein
MMVNILVSSSKAMAIWPFVKIVLICFLLFVGGLVDEDFSKKTDDTETGEKS